jgi:hypothetical protein
MIPRRSRTAIRYAAAAARVRSQCCWEGRSAAGRPQAMFTSAATSPGRPAMSGAVRRLHHSRDRSQEVIGAKEVEPVEYRFRPDSFEVRHARAARPDRCLGWTSCSARREVANRAPLPCSSRPYPARRAPAACRNWRPSIGP